MGLAHETYELENPCPSYEALHQSISEKLGRKVPMTLERVGPASSNLTREERQFLIEFRAKME